SRDRLIEELWAGKPPPGGSQSLDAYLSRLRGAFRKAGAGDVLATRAPGYVLHAEETDARRFEALAAQGREAPAAGAAGVRGGGRGGWLPRRWHCGGVRRMPRWPMSPGRAPRPGGWPGCACRR